MIYTVNVVYKAGGRHSSSYSKTRPGRHKSHPRTTMTGCIQVAVLVGVFVSGAFADLVKGSVSSDGLCTYTFRDVCVSQRMSDVTELRAIVNSLQAQLTLVNKVVAAVPDLRKALRQLSGKVDKKTDKTGKNVPLANSHL